MINLLENQEVKSMMKLDYREGIIFIAGSALYHVLDRIWGLFASLTPEIIQGFTFADLIFTILGVIGVYLIITKRKISGESNLNDQEKSIFSILPEFRINYHDHIEGLFKEVKKNLSPIIKPPDYFTALQKTKEKKRMILQHLYTMDSFSNMYSNMFTIYQLSIATFNDAEKRKKQLLRDLEDFDIELDNYDFGDNIDEHIDTEDFKKAIGIKRNDSTEDFFKNKPLYDFPSGLNCRLYVKPDNNEFKLGYAGHWFARQVVFSELVASAARRKTNR
ncbi:MAG: hypothetical protein H8D35_08535 [Nitrosopumilus sp.]|nr:hypothetical protein [Nitrosopumilus sp.]